MSFKFERLDAWQMAIAFCDRVMSVADNLPQRYQYSLADHLRWAALSVPTNIAEGCGRDNPNECRYFCQIAKGSTYEVVSLLVIGSKRGLLSDGDYRALYTEANALAAIIHGLARAQKNPPP